MTVTSVRLILDLVSGTAIKEGSTPTITDVDASCTLADLATGEGVARLWATFEPSEWLLDGNYKILPASGASVGIISGTIGDAAGDFAVPPELRIDFDTDYNMEYGILLIFSEVTEDYCIDLDIDFYDSGDVLLDSDSYVPDDYKYFCDLPATPIEDIAYIIITFNTMSSAYRHLRLTDILYDSIEFAEEDVKEAVIAEQIDRAAVELPFSTLETKLFSADSDFSIINPSGLYSKLEQNQKIDAYEIIDGVPLFLGRFYLEDWNSLSSTEMLLSAVDAIGVLDKIPFLLDDFGYVYAGVGDFPLDSGDLATEIMAGTGIGHELDASLDGLDVFGRVPIVSRRLALQYLAFRLSAYITCTRSKNVLIVPMELSTEVEGYDYHLTDAELSETSPIKLKPYVSGIELVAHDFAHSDGTTQIEILNDTFANGTYIIILKTSVFSLQIFGTATYAVDDIRTWEVEFTVTGGGTVRFTEGTVLVDTPSLARHDDPSPPENYVENVLKIDNCWFTEAATALLIAEVLFAFYQERYLQKTKLFVPDVQLGDVVLVDTSETEFKLLGIVEKMTTDLARGFVSEVEISGVIIIVLGAGKYDDRDVTIYWSNTDRITEQTYAVGYLNTQTETADAPLIYLQLFIDGSSFDIGYIGWTDVAEMHIQIDGGTVIDVNTQMGVGAKTAESWSSGALGAGEHYVRIWGGGGGGEYILFDYIEVFA